MTATPEAPTVGNGEMWLQQVRQQLTKGRPAQRPAAVGQALMELGQDHGSPFSPGVPLEPGSGYGGEPRAWNYPTGYNIVSRPARDQRVSFETLKGLIDSYDVARMAIGHRIDDVRSLDYSIVPRRGFSGDSDAAVEAAHAIMRRPEGPGTKTPFRAWLAKYLEDVLRYDAGCLFRRRDRANRVIGLKVVSGLTIAPMLDYWGDTPLAPAPAYAQFVQGMPWKWFTVNDLIYEPFRPQPDSPYGFAPLEAVLLTANTDLRFQMHFLSWFTQGTVPEGFAMAPEDISSPEQLAIWQEYWDALLYGDDAAKHQIKWLPSGTKIEFPAIKEFNPEFSLYLMRKVAAAYHVTPNDLGFTEDVNRAVGETQVDVQFRVGTKPLVQHVEDIITDYLQEDRGLPVEFNFDTGQEKEDRVQIAQAHKIYVDMGAESVDEVRTEELGLPIDNERPMPRFVNNPRTGPIPLASILAIAGAIDPETGAPVNSVPLPIEPFDGAQGVLPDKAPGGTQFKRAPINPDEPQFPELEHPVPGSEVVGTRPGAPVIGEPVAKEVTAGITAATGITGHDDVHADEDEAQLAKAELAVFGRFVKARRRDGKWRNFQFTAADSVNAQRLNARGRAAVRKDAGQLVAAGLCVQAADTGRVLMLQRALDPTDPAGGYWEFPGGHIEDGETARTAACREWQEEAGCLLPIESIVALAFRGPTWAASNGVYQGYVLEVPSESSLSLALRGQVSNPDDPDGDVIEALAWWNPADLLDNPVIRPELAADLPLVMAALEPAGQPDEALPLEDGQHNFLTVDEVRAAGAEVLARQAADALAKADDAGPKASWRDSAEKVPQHRFDLRLTDYYAPRITDALRTAFPASVLRAAISGASERVAKAVNEDLQALRSAARDALASSVSTDDLEQHLRELMAEAYQSGAFAAGEQIGPGAVTLGGVADFDWSAWQPGDQAAAALASDGGLADLLDTAGVGVQGIIGTTLDQLGNAIGDGLTRGDSIDTIAGSLEGIVGDPSRAEMIAHTETARATTVATLATYDANGIGLWDWVLSDGACPECEDAAANGPYPVHDSGDQPPKHPRCRCAASPRADSVSSPTESGDDTDLVGLLSIADAPPAPGDPGQ